MFSLAHLSDLHLAGCRAALSGSNPAMVAAQRRLEGAHRRFLASSKTLAMVTKLLRPRRSPLELLRHLPETPKDLFRDRCSLAAADGVPVLN